MYILPQTASPENTLLCDVLGIGLLSPNPGYIDSVLKHRRRASVFAQKP